MSEEHIKNIHGIEIDTRGHEHASHFLEHHMDKEQVHEMVKNAKNNYDHDHNSHFTAIIDGHNKKFELQSHEGKLQIHEVHHH